jgi:hypothetical protein
MAPVRLKVQAPVPAPRNQPGIAMPDDILRFRVG